MAQRGCNHRSAHTLPVLVSIILYQIALLCAKQQCDDLEPRYLPTTIETITSLKHQIHEREILIRTFGHRIRERDKAVQFLRFLQRRDFRKIQELLRGENKGSCSGSLSDKVLPWNQFFSLNGNTTFANDCVKYAVVVNRTKFLYFIQSKYNQTSSMQVNGRNWYLTNCDSDDKYLSHEELMWENILAYTGSVKYMNQSDFLKCSAPLPIYDGFIGRTAMGLYSDELFHLDIGGEGRKLAYSISRDPYDWGGYFESVNINPTNVQSDGIQPIPFRLYGCGYPLPFEDQSIDIITIDSVPIEVDVAIEILRVIRPNGYVSVGGLFGDDWTKIMDDPRHQAMVQFNQRFGSNYLAISKDEQGVSLAFWRWTWEVRT